MSSIATGSNFELHSKRQKNLNTLSHPKYLCIKYEKSTKSNQENRIDIPTLPTGWHANTFLQPR